MSLVGPRPMPPAVDEEIDGWGRRRLDLAPGITGHWQVLGRTSIPFEEMIESRLSLRHELVAVAGHPAPGPDAPGDETGLGARTRARGGVRAKRFVVTGGAGFIGSHIVDRLVETGAKVIAIDDLNVGRSENLSAGVGGRGRS